MAKPPIKPLDTIPEDDAGEKAAEAAEAARLAALKPITPLTPAPTPPSSPTPDNPGSPPPASPTPATPLSKEEEEKRAAALIQKRIDESFDAITIDPDRIGHFKAIQAIHGDATKSFADKEAEIRNYFQSEKSRKTLEKDHAYPDFQKTVLAVFDATKKKGGDGPQTKEESEKEESKKSAFLGIVFDKFKFLGEDTKHKDGDKKGKDNKEKDVNDLISALKGLSEEKGAKELGLDESFKGQYDEHKKETSDRLATAVSKGMTDIQSAKFTMAKEALMKTAQIAAIGALAATGGILVAAVLAGALYWWYSRKAGKDGNKKLSEEEQKALDEKEFAEYQKRENGVPSQKELAEALRKAAEGKGNPTDMEDALDILGNNPFGPTPDPTPVPTPAPGKPKPKEDDGKEDDGDEKEDDGKEKDISPPATPPAVPPEDDKELTQPQTRVKDAVKEYEEKLKEAEEGLVGKGGATDKLREAAAIGSRRTPEQDKTLPKPVTHEQPDRDSDVPKKAIPEPVKKVSEAVDRLKEQEAKRAADALKNGGR